jgi:hypothetical protein
MDRSSVIGDLIQQYRDKIRLYEAMVIELERERDSAPSTRSGAANGTDQKSSGGALENVRSFQFFNKSQPEAAKLLLEFVAHPLLTAEIVDGIEKGGVAVGGKGPKEKKLNLYSILRRSSEFVRWKKDTWGLRSWPGAPKQNDSDSDDESDKSSAQ